MRTVSVRWSASCLHRQFAALGPGRRVHRPCRHGDSPDRPGHREVLPRRRRHDDHPQAGRRPPDRRRPRGADRRSRPRPGHLPPQPRRADPTARQARASGPRGPGALRPRSRPRHVARPRSAARRSSTRADSACPRWSSSTPSPWSRRGPTGSWRPRRSSPIGCASSAWRQPCGSRASTPAPSTRTCATSGCTTSGRAPARGTVVRSWSATPGACTSVTAYGDWRSSPTSPGSASW